MDFIKLTSKAMPSQSLISENLRTRSLNNLDAQKKGWASPSYLSIIFCWKAVISSSVMGFPLALRLACSMWSRTPPALFPLMTPVLALMVEKRKWGL